LKNEYPEIEQVYVFSKWSGVLIDEARNKGIPIDVVLGKSLNEIIFKRFLIINSKPTEEGRYITGWGNHYSSDSEEIKKTLERSLKFNSW
jgi:hypothetical protein